jgi:large subunit ribosomal protein L34
LGALGLDIQACSEARSLTGYPLRDAIAGFSETRRAPTHLQPDRLMKRTYQASKTRRARTHGFLVRMKTRGGRAVINARRAKGRKRLAV